MKTDSPLHVKQISSAEAGTYARIIRKSFNWDDSRLDDWIVATVDKPGYRQYLVSDGNDYIAAGALYVRKKLASMAFAATLPEHRGRGAQSLLLNTRLADAGKLGCNYIFSETAEDKPDNPVTSFRNMLKSGFEVAYLRQNWILEF